jgi:alpha-L-fucosidase
MKTQLKWCAAVVAAVVGWGAAAHAQQADPYPVVDGPFKGTMDSLKANKCPEWFRDAKFGIWAHWGPQAVPMDGDWYARGLYEQGSGHNKYHLEHYGHPSVFGYKDIIPLWTADKFDPERLMALYKKAGAKYFVSMGSHHDNFSLWDDKFHKWNAVNMGPKRDIVGAWQKAAKANGLRFGVSEHLGASFTWFQSAHRSDKTGDKAGVPYDGADPKYADLYHKLADPGDKGWYSNNPEWHQEWYKRIGGLVANYNLDLLYTDGGVPFGDVGLKQIANLYNTSIKNHDGKLETVYTCKQKSEGRWIEDLERGVMPRINPDPWQTDTSIGDWYYNRNWKFRPVIWNIQMLCDIVAKNGNLLLNVVQRPDGSLDPEVETMLGEMAAWIGVNGEAIYSTRPWKIYGEGAVRFKGGSFGEDFKYSSKDIRYTTKGDALYAMLLGWPDDGKAVIRTLGTREGKAAGEITGITMLGNTGALEFKRTDEGLIVTLPAAKPCQYAFTLKIAGKDLEPTELPVVIPVIRQADNGVLTLSAGDANPTGNVKAETKGNQENLGFWDSASDYVEWTAEVKTAGEFEVTASIATINASELLIDAGGAKLTAQVPAGSGWDNFKTILLGKITLTKTGKVVFAAKPASAQTWKAINLRWVKLTPVK